MRKVRIGELLYHLTAFLFFVYTHNFDIGPAPSRITYGGAYKFYTFWNVCLAVVYYGTATLVDLKHLFISHDFRSFRTFRDYLFCSLVIPASITVSAAFWGIYFAAPDLILPASMQKFVPLHGFYNHAAHTAPVLTTILETFFVFHVPPSSNLIGFLGTLFYGSLYAIWVHYIAFMPGGFWTYPFLQVMTDTQRIIFFLCLYIFGFALYYLGARIIKSIWRHELSSISSKSKKRH